MTPPAVAVSHRAGRTVYAQRLRPAAATMTPPAVADLPHARARGGAGVGAPIGHLDVLDVLDVLEGPVGHIEITAKSPRTLPVRSQALSPSFRLA